MADAPSPSCGTPSSKPGRLSGRHVVVGVGGGIACYKVCEVVSKLVQQGCRVTVAMTPAAQKFVTPLTFEALSGQPVQFLEAVFGGCLGDDTGGEPDQRCALPPAITLAAGSGLSHG